MVVNKEELTEIFSIPHLDRMKNDSKENTYSP